MRNFTAIIERCPDTGLYVGSIPGFPGAHSQGETEDELRHNLSDVLEMLLADDEYDYDDTGITPEELNALAWHIDFSSEWDDPV